MGRNYTFASLGRPVGRALQFEPPRPLEWLCECAATRDDNYRIERKLKPSFRAKGMGWDHPLITPQPLLAYFLLTVHCATHGRPSSVHSPRSGRRTFSHRASGTGGASRAAAPDGYPLTMDLGGDSNQRLW